MSSGAKHSFQVGPKKAHLIISSGVRCSQEKIITVSCRKPEEEMELDGIGVNQHRAVSQSSQRREGACAPMKYPQRSSLRVQVPCH